MAILLALLPSIALMPSADVLKLGMTVERPVAVGDDPSWTVEAKDGDFIDVVVDQKSFDLVATLTDPAGKVLATFDTANGDLGPERIRFIATTTAPYRIDLRSAQPEIEPGRYSIRLAAQRPATPVDRQTMAAIAAQMQGHRLRLDPATRASSIAQYERAMALWREAGDRSGEADTLRAMGFAYVRMKDDDHAYETFTRTRAMWRDLKDVRSEAFVMLILGTIHTRRGETLEARARATESLPLWRSAGDAVEEAFTLGEIGTTHAKLKERAETERWYGEAVQVARRTGRHTLEAAINDNFARAYVQLNDPAAAIATHERARALWAQAGHRRGQASSLRSMGALHEAAGDKARAIDAFIRSADFWRAAGMPQEEAADLSRVAKLRGGGSRACFDCV
ncbi:MAG: tetratricopeptide repeat protein [Candidatus Limnocylindrales bacterium]